jgi:PAS domain S-box-containing protein
MNVASVSRRPLRFAKAAGLAVIGIGAAGCLGWIVDIPTLRRGLPGLPSMALRTALALACAGFALWMAAVAQAARRSEHSLLLARAAALWLGRASAAFAALVAVATLVAYAWESGAAAMWLTAGGSRSIDAPDAAYGVMPPATALSLGCLAFALLLGNSTRFVVLYQILALMGGIIAWPRLAHYLLGTSALAFNTQMAAPSAAALLLLSAGTLAARPDAGITSLVISDGPGGMAMRRLLPTLLLVPVVLGRVHAFGLRASWYGAEAGLTLLALSHALVFGVLIWMTALQLQRSELRRQKAVDALKDSEARIRAIVDIALDGIIVMSDDGTVVEFNPAAERIFGHHRSDVLGRPLADAIIPPAMREDHRRGLARYIATGQGPLLGVRFETTGFRADGSEFPVELSISRMPGSGPLQFTGFVRDISARKAAEDRLQSQLARLNLLDAITRAIGERHDLQSVFQVVIRSLEDNLPIEFGCVCLYDATADMLTISAIGVRSEALATELAMTAQARLAIDQNGLSRCVRGELAYEPDIRAATSPFCRLLALGGLGSVVLAPLQSESTVFGVLVAARRQPDGFSSGDCEFLRQLSGHVALAAHQAQILTALQRAYDDLRQTQQAVMQQERLRALGQMASGIAHDINNAVSPVALYTQSLLETETNLTDRGREYLETMQRAIEDVADTVARMREFYRQPEPQIALSSVRMNDLVRQVLDLTRVRWSDMPQQRGVVITVHPDLASDLPIIAGIESEIREALINLVFNAVDAMPDGGTLTVRTLHARDTSSPASWPEVHVEIVDTGTGMDEETRRRCLEPFFTTKGPRGTGLGLAMAYGVMQRHRGEIDVDSIVGAGTTVRLRFPVAPGSAESTTAASRAPETWVRTRILIVDDDPLLLKSLRDVLESDGHTVVAANSGQDGIERFRSAEERHESFGVVITDLGMPHIDGRQVAGAIRAIRASVPVILLTGWGHRLVAEGDVPPHVDLVLNKPPKLRDLRVALAELTARYHTDPRG